MIIKINSSLTDAPTTIITREGTTQSSNNGILQVTAEQGDLAPTFSCSADGSPPPTISWGGQDGGVALPNEVSQTTSSQNQALVWSRPLEYEDSGQYLCSAMNSVGSSAATLDLLVRSESFNYNSLAVFRVVEWENGARGRSVVGAVVDGNSISPIYRSSHHNHHCSDLSCEFHHCH